MAHYKFRIREVKHTEYSFLWDNNEIVSDTRGLDQAAFRERMQELVDDGNKWNKYPNGYLNGVNESIRFYVTISKHFEDLSKIVYEGDFRSGKEVQKFLNEKFKEYTTTTTTTTTAPSASSTTQQPQAKQPKQQQKQKGWWSYFFDFD